jgi:Ni/Co efflux regulator RcnB
MAMAPALREAHFGGGRPLGGCPRIAVACHWTPLSGATGIGCVECDPRLTRLPGADIMLQASWGTWSRKMRAVLLVAIALLWGCATSGPVADGDPHPRATRVADAVHVEVIFTDEEIRIIRAYYESNGYHGKSHGKGKHKGLPPGIAKNLQRGKPLPPGLAKQALPYELQRSLPRPPYGYDRIVVGGKILLIELATQIVRDVLTDVAFG